MSINLYRFNCLNNHFKYCDSFLGYPQYLLMRTLGLCIALCDPPVEQRLQILNEVWKLVTKLRNPTHYMSCAEVWIQFTVSHFTVNQSLLQFLYF